jgi:hypothetical protein
MTLAVSRESTRKVTLASVFILVLSTLCGCSLNSHTLTEYEIPTPVLVAFRAAHPRASEISYQQTMRRETKIYRIQFTESGLEQDTEYTVEGKPIIGNPSVSEAETASDEENPQGVRAKP